MPVITDHTAPRSLAEDRPPAADAVGRIAAGPVVITADGVEPRVRPVLSMARITELVGARSLWRQGITGSGVNIAIIDTGVAPVEALSTPGKVVAMVDVSADHHDRTRACVDQHGHGTHLAGILAGRTPGADPIDRERADAFFGVAPDAGIVAVKVAGRDGDVDAASLLTGIEWVIAHARELDIRVLNIAFSADGAEPLVEQALHAAVERAWAAGIVVVTAAGNGGPGSAGLVSPSTNPYVVSVGSVTVEDDDVSPSGFTSRGDGRRRPDLAAPGAHVESLRAPGSAADTDHPEGYVDAQRFLGSGSSQSAAVVAGVAALVLQAHADWTPDQVKQALVAGARTVPGSPDSIGAGLVDARRALVAVPSNLPQSWDRTEATPFPATAGIGRIAIEPTGTSWMGNSWTGTSWMGTSWMGNSWTGTSWMGNSWM